MPAGSDRYALLHRFGTVFRYPKNHSKPSLQRQARGLAMALRGSIRVFSQKYNQRADRPRRGRIRGISAAEPKPQTTESTICEFSSAVGRAANSLRYGMCPPSGKAWSMEEPVHDGDLQRIQDHSHFPSESRCRVSTSSRSPSPRQTERSTRLTLRPRSASPTAGAAPYKFWRSLSQVLQVARLRENTAQAKSVPLFSGDLARNFRMVAQGLLAQGNSLSPCEVR